MPNYLSDDDLEKLKSYSKGLDEGGLNKGLKAPDMSQDPMIQGILSGGVMGGVANVGKAAVNAAAPGAFGRIKQMLGQGGASEASAIPQGFTQTAARLEASHPAMVKNRDVINGLVDQLGAQHPDVATLQNMYNKMLK